MGITKARGDIDEFPCSLHWEEGTSRWRGVKSHKRLPNAMKSHLLLRSLSRKGIAHWLMVDFKVVSKPSQTFCGQITRRMALSDPSCLGFPTNPRVTRKLNKLKANEIWVGGNVDRDFLLLSTKIIWLWLGRMEDPQVLVFQQRVRESPIKWMVHLTSSRRRKGFI
jgi:hypothetical protein